MEPKICRKHEREQTPLAQSRICSILSTPPWGANLQTNITSFNNFCFQWISTHVTGI